MSGTSINLTLFFMWCVIICSSVVCSAEYAPSDTQGFLRRLYRSDKKADTSEHKVIQPPSVPNKLSPDDKQKNVEGSTSSNISVTAKIEDSKPDLHLNQPAGGTQHDNSPAEGTQQDNLPVGGHNLNQGALLRGFYVFVGLSAIVVIYIVVKTISVRRKKSTVRKYGILTNREDVEMTPLGAEDEEEDTTLFDVSNQTRP